MLNVYQLARKRMSGCTYEEEFFMEEHIKECIDRALVNQEINENIKYKGVPYDFKDVIDRSEIE